MPATPKEKARTSAKSWATKISNKLAVIVQKGDEADPSELEEAMAEFDKRLATLDEAQQEAELDIEDADTMEKDIEAGFAYREKIMVPRTEATKLYKKLNKQDDQDTVKTNNTVVETKLPKLELKTFSGDILEWIPWWEQYNAVIHANEMPEVQKFAYLRSVLKGEALACIEGLSLTTANYSAAIDALKDRYNKTERIRFAHIQGMLSLSVNIDSPEGLYGMFNSLTSHVRSLENLGL